MVGVITICCPTVLLKYYWLLSLCCPFFKKINVYLHLKEKDTHTQTHTDCTSTGGAERGRPRIGSRLLALSCQHRAWRGAGTHELWDRDLSPSRTLNRMSHPGAPLTLYFLYPWFIYFITGSSVSSFGSLFCHLSTHLTSGNYEFVLLFMNLFLFVCMFGVLFCFVLFYLTHWFHWRWYLLGLSMILKMASSCSLLCLRNLALCV